MWAVEHPCVPRSADQRGNDGSPALCLAQRDESGRSATADPVALYIYNKETKASTSTRVLLEEAFLVPSTRISRVWVPGCPQLCT